MKTSKSKKLLEALREYDKADKALNKASEIKEAARAAIIAELNRINTDEIRAGNYTVIRKETTRRAFSAKEFRQDYPELYESYKRIQYVHHFNVNTDN